MNEEILNKILDVVMETRGEIEETKKILDRILAKDGQGARPHHKREVSLK